MLPPCCHPNSSSLLKSTPCYLFLFSSTISWKKLHLYPQARGPHGKNEINQISHSTADLRALKRRIRNQLNLRVDGNIWTSMVSGSRQPPQRRGLRAVQSYFWHLTGIWRLVTGSVSTTSELQASSSVIGLLIRSALWCVRFWHAIVASSSRPAFLHTVGLPWLSTFYYSFESFSGDTFSCF